MTLLLLSLLPLLLLLQLPSLCSANCPNDRLIYVCSKQTTLENCLSGQWNECLWCFNGQGEGQCIAPTQRSCPAGWNNMTQSEGCPDAGSITPLMLLAMFGVCIGAFVLFLVVLFLWRLARYYATTTAAERSSLVRPFTFDLTGPV